MCALCPARRASRWSRAFRCTLHQALKAVTKAVTKAVMKAGTGTHGLGVLPLLRPAAAEAWLGLGLGLGLGIGLGLGLGLGLGIGISQPGR